MHENNDQKSGLGARMRNEGRYGVDNGQCRRRECGVSGGWVHGAQTRVQAARVESNGRREERERRGLSKSEGQTGERERAKAERMSVTGQACG